jgi:NADP-dependent 3-hydroxy acid dehydrogenase YdfG
MFAQPIPVNWEVPSLDVVTQTVMKKYCSLIHGQPVLEAVLDLKRRIRLNAADIENVRCDVFQGAFDFAGGDRLDAIVKNIQAVGAKALAVSVDVANRAPVEALVQQAIDTYGKIDVLVNNAGIMPIAPLSLLKVDEWDRMIDLNIKGVLYGIAAALPHMKKQKSGHINTASVFGIKVFAPGGTVYCATKAAVRTLTEGLRMEVHGDGIRTTIISPGAVDSELKASTSDYPDRRDVLITLGALAAGAAIGEPAPYLHGMTASTTSQSNTGEIGTPMITTKDGTQIFYKGWGSKDAQPIVFHHG